MAAVKEQLGLAGLKTAAERDAEDAEKAARREARNILRHRLMAAIRTFAKGQTDAIAAELSDDVDVFGADAGKNGVSGSLLRACMTGGERNYFRLDWIFYLLEESDDVAAVMLEACGHGKPQKTPEQYAKDLEDTLREELSQNRADRAIRKARAR